MIDHVADSNVVYNNQIAYEVKMVDDIVDADRFAPPSAGGDVGDFRTAPFLANFRMGSSVAVMGEFGFRARQFEGAQQFDFATTAGARSALRDHP
jgi:hypothetical protein